MKEKQAWNRSKKEQIQQVSDQVWDTINLHKKQYYKQVLNDRERHIEWNHLCQHPQDAVDARPDAGKYPTHL